MQGEVGPGAAGPARSLLRITIAAAAIASVANILGGITFHSRLLVLNGLTCIANLVTTVVSSFYYLKSMMPPDKDHPLGHAGYSFSSAVFALLVYAFVLGLGVDEVLNPSPYRVSGIAWTVPLGVAVLYSIAVLAGKSVGGEVEVYANLTTSEIAESLVALVITPLAHSYGYWIDRLGALGMLIYLAYQVVTNGRSVLYELSMPSPPPELVNRLINDIRSMGYEVKDLRLRSIARSQVIGYVVIGVPSDLSVEEAHKAADLLERLAKSKYNVDLVVHVEPKGPERNA
ncbi:MAG: cation diffusion facilitator family transporter [Acidilobus sp.]